MVKLKINNISNYDYELEDMKENKYTLNIEYERPFHFRA